MSERKDWCVLDRRTCFITNEGRMTFDEARAFVSQDQDRYTLHLYDHLTPLQRREAEPADPRDERIATLAAENARLREALIDASGTLAAWEAVGSRNECPMPMMHKGTIANIERVLK